MISFVVSVSGQKVRLSRTHLFLTALATVDPHTSTPPHIWCTFPPFFLSLQFHIYRPPNYALMAGTVLALLVGIGVLYAAWPYVGGFFRNPRLWAMLAMVSGHVQ